MDASGQREGKETMISRTDFSIDKTILEHESGDLVATVASHASGAGQFALAGC